MKVYSALNDYSSFWPWAHAMLVYLKSILAKYDENISNKEFVESNIGVVGNKFNCWGATLAYFKLLPNPTWISQRLITAHLEDSFKRIKPRKISLNDVAAFYDKDGQLVHTAVLVGKNKWFHKRGSNVCCIQSMRELLKTYNETDKIRYYRFSA